MEQVEFTTLCMVTDENGNVLVQRREYGAWQGIAFPGGHVEPGESFLCSAVREIEEETGYILDDPLLCGIKQFQKDDGSRYVIFLYRASRFHGTLNSSEEGDVFWVKRDELPKLLLAKDLLATLPLFEDDKTSEFYYYKEQDKWKYRIV